MGKQTTERTETTDIEQPHGHLKRLISCLNAHKSHQIHWKQHLALRLRFVVIVTGTQAGTGDAFGLLTFLLPSSEAHPAVINMSGNGDDVHCVLARPGASRRQCQRRCLPSGKRQTNDSWLDKHLDGGSTKRASNGKLWNYAIRFRTHRRFPLPRFTSPLLSSPRAVSPESNEVVLDPGDLSWLIRLNSSVRTTAVATPIQATLAPNHPA